MNIIKKRYRRDSKRRKRLKLKFSHYFPQKKVLPVFLTRLMKMLENPSLSISEVAKELGRPMTALSGAMKELVTKGYVEYLPGKKYTVAYHRIKEIFSDVLETRQKK
jgi:predicted transcriptional regulator